MAPASDHRGSAEGRYIDRSLLRAQPLAAASLETCLEVRVLPWRREGATLYVAAPSPCARARAFAASAFGADARLVPIAPGRFDDAVRRLYAPQLHARACTHLAQRDPSASARQVVTRRQAAVFGLAGLAIATAGWFAPALTAAAAVGLMAMLYVANFLFRGILAGLGAVLWRARRLVPGDPPAELPVYTLLVPLYREANVVAELIAALGALDYPRDRLDVKLILEADDAPTIAAVRGAALGPEYDIVLVPPGLPRTKPKALNYALPFARGTLLVVFDAEDRPEPDQLRKAAAVFAAASPDVVCLQAKLSYWNGPETLLTRLFALEYGLWFDFMLPGLDAARLPMPLGGTSNHFRTAGLRAAGGWDAWNVTEDADLGLRLSARGLGVRVLDSTTFEEAIPHLRPWLAQRARWMKGFMQTWLVRMRAPRAYCREVGWRGFLAFQLFIGGAVATALINPLLWAFFAHWLLGGIGPGVFDQPLVRELGLISLGLGNGLLIALTALGAVRRPGLRGIAWAAVLAPAYWVLISAAAWRAVWELLSRPHAWSKSPHGLTRLRFTRKGRCRTGAG